MRTLVAVQRCVSSAGTAAGAVTAAAGSAAGWLTVARVELCHQNIAMNTATAVTIAAAAIKSPRVRRSGASKVVSSGSRWPRPHCADGDAADVARHPRLQRQTTPGSSKLVQQKNSRRDRWNSRRFACAGATGYGWAAMLRRRRSVPGRWSSPGSHPGCRRGSVGGCSTCGRHRWFLPRRRGCRVLRRSAESSSRSRPDPVGQA